MTAIRATNGSYLDDDTMIRYAPSIFTQLKHPDRSSAYRHIPTAEVLKNLRANGFMPVQVSQSGGPIADSIRGLFARHAIRFRQTENLDVARGDVVPELLLLNSHDGSGSYKLYAGLLRIICLNGLVAGAGDIFHIGVRHSGNTDLPTRVLAASKKIIEAMPALFERVDRLRNTPWTEARRINFARASLKLVPSRLTFDASELLTPRRANDMDTDAWTTMNVVQENIIRGGIEAQDRRGSTRRTASISDVEKDTLINRGVWDLAEAA